MISEKKLENNWTAADLKLFLLIFFFFFFFLKRVVVVRVAVDFLTLIELFLMFSTNYKDSLLEH